MKKILVFLFMLFFSYSCWAQYDLSIVTRDTGNKELLHGVNATIANTSRTVASDSTGKIIFHNLSVGVIKIIFSHIGYQNQTISFKIPQQETLPVVFLHRATEKTEEEVIISSSRTNSRIEDLPTKVEVIGSEEVDEEAGTMPGNIASLLGDVAGIQNQRSSVAPGNMDLRDKGLPGKYIQILKDG